MTKLHQRIFVNRNREDDAVNEDWYLFLVPNVIFNLNLALDVDSVWVSILSKDDI